jgi:hypothetical protein
MEKLITGPNFDKYSLLASFLFLIKDIKSEEKAKELLVEIKRMLMEKVDDNFINDYLDINEKLKNKIYFDFQITIDQDNITNSKLYLNDFDKTYYLFNKLIRVNFNKNAKLFQYSDFMIYNYIKYRSIYLYENNIIINLVDEIKKEIDNNKCQKAKNYINSNEKNKKYRYFFDNLFNDMDKDFYIPIDLISKILQTNIILLNKDKKFKKVIENDENYKYILLIEKNKNYTPIYTKEKKIFYIEDTIIKQLLENNEEDEDDRLDKIMPKEEKNVTNDIKEYVSNLGLEEA